MRHKPPLLRTVALLAGSFVLVVVVVLCFWRIERVVVGDGAFVGPSRPVRAPRAGVLVELLVEPGARVEAGAVLARLDASEWAPQRAELAAQRAGLDGRRAQMARERSRAAEVVQPAEIEASKRAQDAAQLVLEAARVKEQRYGELQTQGLVEGVEYDESLLARKLAEVELENARARRAQQPAEHAAFLAGLDAQSAALEHELDGLAAREAELELRASRSELVAPVAGCLLGPARAELIGRAVLEGEELLRVAVAGVDAFVAHVDDRGRARIDVGQPAKLRLNGYPWLVHGTATAKVVLVADRADERGYLVRLELDGAAAPGPLFEGMAGKARIATAERVPIAWLLLEEAFGFGAR